MNILPFGGSSCDIEALTREVHYISNSGVAIPPGTADRTIVCVEGTGVFDGYYYLPLFYQKTIRAKHSSSIYMQYYSSFYIYGISATVTVYTFAEIRILRTIGKSYYRWINGTSVSGILTEPLNNDEDNTLYGSLAFGKLAPTVDLNSELKLPSFGWLDYYRNGYFKFTSPTNFHGHETRTPAGNYDQGTLGIKVIQLF